MANTMTITNLILHMLTIAKTHNKYIAYMNTASHASVVAGCRFRVFRFSILFLSIPNVYTYSTNTHIYSIQCRIRCGIFARGEGIWCVLFRSRNQRTNKRTNIHERRRATELCGTQVKQAKSIVMPFSESHFSRAQ